MGKPKDARRATKHTTGERAQDLRKRLAHVVTTHMQAGMAQMIRACIAPVKGEAAWIAHGDERGLSDDGTGGAQDL